MSYQTILLVFSDLVIDEGIITRKIAKPFSFKRDNWFLVGTDVLQR